MVRYIGKRLLMMIPVLLGIVLIVFCMNHISSGNPARMLLGVGASDEAIAALEEELGVLNAGLLGGHDADLAIFHHIEMAARLGPGRLEELDLAHLHLQHGRHGHHH